MKSQFIRSGLLALAITFTSQVQTRAEFTNATASSSATAWW